MKKLSFILAALLVCGAMQAQISFDFEDGTLQGWTTIDADGDGHNWQRQSANGLGHLGSDGVLLSFSVDPTTGNPLTPDNYLVSPQISLNSQYPILSFYACALDEYSSAEHFAVAISTTVNDDPLAFANFREWTLMAKCEGKRQGNWYRYTVDISNYAGQEVYIAFRHFSSTGYSAICIDDIFIEGSYDGVEEEAESVGVYPNPAKDRVVIEGVEAAEVQVYNALGQMVKTVRRTNEIDLSGLVEGVYLLRIIDADGKVYTNKIMKR